MAPSDRQRGSISGAVSGAPLPASIEAAYRQKCIDLKKRLSEVEDANNVLRTKVSRSKRGIMKLRLERAFLLEQLTKRTSARVDDSEGSPSPPPTPQERPLRSKRNHRKDGPGGAGAGDAPAESSPLNSHNPYFPPAQSSPSHHATASAQQGMPQQQPTSGKGSRTVKGHAAAGPAPKRPANKFMIFCESAREDVRKQLESDPNYEPSTDYDLHRALAAAWKNLGKDGQKPYYDQYNRHYEEWRAKMDAWEEKNHFYMTHPEEAAEALRQQAAGGNVTDPVAEVVEHEIGPEPEAEGDGDGEPEVDEVADGEEDVIEDVDMDDGEGEGDVDEEQQDPPTVTNGAETAPKE